MKLSILSNARFLLKQISFSFNNFKKALRGEKGEKKQLEALIVDHYPEEFINSIINGIELEKLPGVEYCNEKHMVEFYGYRLFNMKLWRSRDKKNRLKANNHTPLCFVFWHIQAQQMFKGFTPLFGVPLEIEKFTPSDKICPKCKVVEGCTNGGKKFTK